MINASRQSCLRYLFSLGLLCLSIAVFNWGLQYKMSLYHADNGLHAPAAKLWTGRVGEAPEEVRSSAIHPDLPAPATLLLVCCFLLAAHSAGSLTLVPFSRPSSGRNFKARLHPSLSFFFFRPPPVKV